MNVDSKNTDLSVQSDVLFKYFKGNKVILNWKNISDDEVYSLYIITFYFASFGYDLIFLDPLVLHDELRLMLHRPVYLSHMLKSKIDQQ